MREGLYYRLDCMNALASGLYKASDFTGDEEAIETASNYEATLTKEEYRRIKEELEKERESTSGYYHEPEHFYSIGED